MLSGDSKVLRGQHCSHIPPADPKQHFQNCVQFCTHPHIFSVEKFWVWGQDTGSHWERPTGTAIFRLLWGAFLSAVHPQIFFFLPSSVCFATLQWEISKEKSGFFFLAHFLHCRYHQEHGTSQTASAERSGILGSHFQTFSLVITTISARGRRGDIYYALSAPGSRLEAAP